MLGLSSPFPLALQNPKFFPVWRPLSVPNLSLSSPRFKSRPCLFRRHSKLLLFAQNSNSNGGSNPSKDPNVPLENGPDNGDRDSVRDRRPVLDFRWRDLLDPDPDNVLAVGLTGLLAWASVQVLWQLLFISLAILVAALKYSFIAALLIFILIALL